MKLSKEDVQLYQRMNNIQQEEFLKLSTLGLGSPSTLMDKIQNPLADMFQDYDNPHLQFIHFMSRPENFWFTCKWLFNINLAPFQVAILQELWNRKFPMLLATRGGGKTFLLAIYAMLRAIFTPSAKIVVIGAAFRQSKLIFEVMENIYRNSPILRDICGGGKAEGPKRDIDQCVFYIGSSTITAIPLGDGTKIRGLRAHYIIADEFASIPMEIFEVVIRGFGSVSANPTERAEKIAKIALLNQLGETKKAIELEETLGFGNQTIISGTAYYSFNHFYSYWKKYKGFVESGGDYNKLMKVSEGQLEDDFDWKNYSVIRLPYTSLPKGFMDDASISQGRAIMNRSRFHMEYGACFADDSDGFFKRSLIETCVTKNPIVLPSGESIKFSSMTSGNPAYKYVYGIDPASESDNFAIVILEVHPTHRRIVYSWTLNKEKLRERLKKQGGNSNIGFYNYCGRKIRELMKIFPTEHIGIDSQGGGLQLMETLKNDKDMLEGEQPLWPYVVDNSNVNKKDPFWWETEKKPTDGEAGQHILHIINFAKSDFTSEANHGLKKDFESKVTLFPSFDTALLADAIFQDKLSNREFDTLEDAMSEIEELKDELATIEHTQTTLSGREQWNTPQIKKPGGKIGRLRKDRYSALVIANMLARAVENRLKGVEYQYAGGFAGQDKPRSGGTMYRGPNNIVSQLPTASYRGISRRRK